MANISCKETAERLLAQCVQGEKWDRELLSKLLGEGCEEELFRTVAEGLADRFDPKLCQVYKEIFTAALDLDDVARAFLPAASTFVSTLFAPDQIFVLSRITLGADVAVTSVILDAAKQRFPQAAIHLVSPKKNWELFSHDPRIYHTPITYSRGSISDRLAHLPALRAAVDHPDALVIDPDSRLTQLGLLRICNPANYLFYESRSYGSDTAEALPTLTARWCSKCLGAAGKPYIAVQPAELPVRPAIAISLGTAENPNKRLLDPFEQNLIDLLATRGTLYIDAGAGGEEAERVHRAIANLSPDRVRLCRGSFAEFAAIIQSADLYVGYDSAGQHVAAACAVPQITVFAGEPCERMFQRWRPTGHDRLRIVRANCHTSSAVLRTISGALDELWL